MSSPESLVRSPRCQDLCIEFSSEDTVETLSEIMKDQNKIYFCRTCQKTMDEPDIWNTYQNGFRKIYLCSVKCLKIYAQYEQ